MHTPIKCPILLFHANVFSCDKTPALNTPFSSK